MGFENVQPIETVWRGYRFRSRLEARWAVYFDSLGLRWEYEAEGFDLGPAGRYLPDFWLPKFNGGLFVECKPSGSDILAEDWIRWKALVEKSRHCLLLAMGTPSPRAYTLITFWREEGDARGLILSGMFNTRYLPGGSKLEPGETGRLYVEDFPRSHEETRENDQIAAWGANRAAIKAARSARFEWGEAPT